jgi:DNA-binding PadR family transcriptional regulator
MEKKEFILAVLCTKSDHKYSPVQVQKLFFLIDRLLAPKLNQVFFNFQPYHYGPFDSTLYKELEDLFFNDFLKIYRTSYNGYRIYSLTDKGIHKGNECLKELKKDIQSDIADLNNFVTSLSFTELLSVIYKEYPDMKVNSIFNC